VKKFKNWGIQSKLFTVLGVLFFMVLIFGALWHYQLSKKEMVNRVLGEARVLNGVLMATLQIYQRQFVESGIPLNEKTLGLLPVHALKKVSDNFNNRHDSGLSFNNVSDRPRNPENRADAIEMEAIRFFREHREENERLVSFKNAQGDVYFHYSQPIWIKQYCLQCHGPREAAPPSIQKLYANAYDYKLGDLRGLLSIKLPADIVNRAAMQRFLKELSFFVVFFVTLYFVIQYLLRQLVTLRLAQLSHNAQQVAAGKDAVLPGDGSMDEIGHLENSINQMVDRIRQREQDLVITLNSIGDAVIATDADGNITRLNPVAEQLTGWSLQEAQGLPVKTIFSIIDSTTREPIENPVEKVISSGETVYLSNHTTLISKNGSQYHIADSAAPIRNGEDGIQGMVLVFNDVTEQYQLRRKAAESLRNLQAIMNYSPAVICVRDIDGLYTFINKQFEELFHIQQKDIIGKSPHDVFPKEMADEMQCNHKAVLMKGQALRSEDIVPHGDEPHHYVSIKFPLLDSHDNIYAVCNIATDITEFKNQEEQVRRSQKMDVIGQLAGGIAHDFNNVLTIIMGNLELLKGQVTKGQHLDKEKTLKRVETIGKAGQRAADLTKQLLSFSRNEASMAAVTDINQVIRGMESLIARSVTPEVEVVERYADNLWLTEIDPGNFEDSLLNLCINARDAMAGHGHLVIETRNITLDASYCKQNPAITPGDYVELTVSDNGEGIPHDLQEHIFEPFYTTKEQGKGTGLGLAMVFGFARRSRGHIKCYSEVGVGTTFHLYLPRVQGKVKSGDHSGEQVEALPHGTESILVVDDEINLVELAREFLEALGYKVYTANDGKQALEILAKESTIDLLFSDVVMPGGINGYQLAQQATAKHPQLKVLLTSGYTGKAVFHNEQELFQENLLGKPYNQTELATRVRAALDVSLDGSEVL